MKKARSRLSNSTPWRIAAVVALLIAGTTFRSVSAEKLQFNRDIRPILSDRCFKCHGPDKGTRKGGLRLDLSEEAYAERKKSHEFPIVPGHPEKSLVCKKIFSTDPDDQMPPPDSNVSLSPAEKNTLKRWISEGAVYQPHWAYIPLPDRVDVPRVKNSNWSRNEIDRFILARLEAAKLKPSAEANRERLLRRVTYDLTGLPPTPAEVDAFLADKSKNAYEKVVDRLLASPHFGERLAVPWLDAARYADSYGYQSDQLCPTWPYRDWVVRAFNRNLPYSDFLTEQLAGDLLPNASREQRLATAYNRLHRQTNEGGSIEDEWRNEYVSDRVHTFSTSVMALTFECTRCHDHKYDPFTQRDYYGLGAFFSSIDEYGLYNDTGHVPTPSLLLPTPDQEKAMKETAQELSERRDALRRAIAGAGSDYTSWLKSAAPPTDIAGLVAHFTFDSLTTNNQFANLADPNKSSGTLRANSLVPGRNGQAVKFTGDDELAFPALVGGLQPWQAYTVSMWLNIPAATTNAVIFEREDGTDVGFHGTEFALEGGHLFYVIKRFWPGNAIAVRSAETIPGDQWVHITASYDGLGQAEGMRLYLNGAPLKAQIVRNHLEKSPENGGEGFTFGALFRSTGLKNGLLDELKIFNRAISAIEVKQVYDGHALADAFSTKSTDLLKSYYLESVSVPVATARGEVSAAVRKYLETRNPVQETSVMEDLAVARPAYVLARGRYDAPKTADKLVGRITPASLIAFPANAPRNRLGLAEWVTDPHNPLTARVAINRFWQMLFGRGIVSTPENFGVQGATPSHPELLDWLARDFVNSGWNVKATLKKIVLSATYRQDSRLRPDLREKDPENILLARGPSHRLPAEMIRDTALEASGLLDADLGGPPVSPYMPGDLWRESNSMSPGYHQSVGGALYRRSLYTVWKRTAPMPNMMAFDAPSREVCTVKRNATGTPQQAFVLLNDVQFVEAARVLAEKALKEGGHSNSERIGYIFERLAARPPDATENRILGAILDEQQAGFQKEPDRAKKLVEEGDHKRDPNLNEVELAAMTTVAQAVLNLDATVWER